MASELFLLPFRPAFDANGIVVPGAQLFFYATGTTTPQAVYSDDALTTPLANPVEANSAGVWPAIYLDQSKTYRVVLKDEGGATLSDVDPYVSGVVDNLAADVAADAAAAAVSAAEAELFALAIQLLGAGFIFDDAASGVDPVTGVDDTRYFVTWEGARLRVYLNDGGVAVLKAELPTDAFVALTYAKLVDLAASSGAGLVGFLQSGTGAVGRTTQSKMRELVSAKDFGATGNGSTNDSAAIIAADAAAAAIGATLYFPAGVYIVTPDAVSGSTSWLGESRDTAIIKTAAVTFTNLTGLVKFDNQSDFTVSRLGFDLGGGTYPAGVGNPGNIFWAVRMLLCDNWAVDDCKVINMQAHCAGVAVDACTSFSVCDNYFQMPTPSGEWNQAVNISVSSGMSENYLIADNECNGSGMLTNGAHGTFTRNRIYNWKFGGGIVTGPNPECANHIITDNDCSFSSGTDVNGVHPAGIENWSPYSTITGNTCSYNAGEGIGNGGYACTISDNVVLNNGQAAASAGISMVGITDYVASECAVTGNIIKDTQGTHTMTWGIAEAEVSGSPMVKNNYANNYIAGVLTAPMRIVSDQTSFNGPKLFGSKSSSPGTLSAGGTYDDTLFIAGARVGDFVTFGYTADTRGFSMTGNVDTDNNVIIHIQNISGSSKAFPASTLKVTVEKPQDYAEY